MRLGRFGGFSCHAHSRTIARRLYFTLTPLSNADKSNWLRSNVEPSQPLVNDLKSFQLETIYTFAATLLMRNQTRCLQDTKVPGGGGPGVTEAAGDLARGHTAAAKFHRQQNLATRWMGQRVEDRLQGGQAFLWARSSH